MKTYFCVFPHCLVRTNDGKVLLLDPCSKSFIVSKKAGVVASFSNADNYVFAIEEEEKEFYIKAELKQLGYIIEAETLPFAAKPKLAFISSMEKEKKALGYSTGWHIPSLIKFVSVYLNNTKIHLPHESLYAQLEYPKFGFATDVQSQTVWDRINSVIKNSPVEIVYICGDVDDMMIQALNRIKKNDYCTLVVRTAISEYDKAIELLGNYSKLKLDFIVNDPCKIQYVLDISNQVLFTYPIISLADLDYVEEKSNSHLRYLPLVYDTKKQSELIEQMLLSLIEILESITSIEECLIKGAINRNFWGHIIVTEEGNLCVGNDLIGDIYNKTIYALMADYLQKPQNLWLLTRDKKPSCSDCLLSLVCPCISIYEKQGFISGACSNL